VQAIFPSFPAFFAQSPSSPANIVPAANAPAATSAMSLVIVEAETFSASSSFNFEIVWHLPAGRVSLLTLKIEAKEEIFLLNHPFRISRGSRTEAQVVVVTVNDGEHIGRGEGVPIARYNQTVGSVLAQIESIQGVVDLDRDKLQQLLSPGATRNALNCALWDLEAKRSGKRAWELANIPIVDQVETSFTISLDTPEKMAAAAQGYSKSFREHDGAPGPLKLKLYGGDDVDLARVEAVHEIAPEARLLIDANESWSVEHYRKTVPALTELRVELIEQPFPAGTDEVLETLDHPIPICADESCHTTADLPRLKNRYEAINIKLDKTGGLTEALQLYQRARENDFKILIGCMVCTSLSIAPARLLASTADWVDLDGPLLLVRDRDYGLHYQNGKIGMPVNELWG
jgi:L-alanine-DL-glutamate epimerase-like enolase superfamily enzyme